MDSGILNKESMASKARSRYALNNYGLSLLEVAIVMFIIGALLSVIIPGYTSRIHQARYEKTIHELAAIAQAAVDYFVAKGFFPAGIGSLPPEFIPKAVVLSPFGTSYQISCFNNMVVASVLVPAGITAGNTQGPLLVVRNQGSWDEISISQTVHSAFTTRLKYDLKYVY